MKLKDRLSKLEQVADGDDSSHSGKCAELIAERCAELIGDKPVSRVDKTEDQRLIGAVLADIRSA